MLETIREYAAERLDESGDASDVRRRHADFFLALAESTEPFVRAEELGGGGGNGWIARHASSTIRVPRSTSWRRLTSRNWHSGWRAR